MYKGASQRTFYIKTTVQSGPVNKYVSNSNFHPGVLHFSGTVFFFQKDPPHPPPQSERMVELNKQQVSALTDDMKYNIQVTTRLLVSTSDSTSCKYSQANYAKCNKIKRKKSD